MFASVLLLLAACASQTARRDCAGEGYVPGTPAYATCYGNVDRQQTEMIDQMEMDEARDAAGPLGGGEYVPPP
jgi:hypothetical protein